MCVMNREDCKFYEQLEQIFLKEISMNSLPEDMDMTGELESFTDSDPGEILSSEHQEFPLQQYLAFLFTARQLFSVQKFLMS